PLQFVIQQEPMGLGHAILCAESVVEGLPVLILLGDTIVDFDFFAMLKADSVIGVKAVADPRRFGVVILKDGVIQRIVEKPVNPISNLAIVGVYYFKNSVALYRALNQLVNENRHVGKEYQFTDAMQILVDQGVEIRTIDIDVWLDCGTPQALLETNRILLDRQGNCRTFTDSIIVPPVFIADDAVIEHSVIGPYVSLSSKAKVVESIIWNALVYQGAHIHRSILVNSIIGEGSSVKCVCEPVNLGPNSSMENG
ncbi:MAG: sugar phosphate nucleotidyltransferase, partial [bacterium]